MKTPLPSRFLRPLAFSLALAFAFVLAGFSPTSAPAEETTASIWTESDSRLANHYIQLLQRDPAYGKVLDLLWDLYGKKDQTPLLLEYFRSASESGPTVAKLIYAHLLRKGGDAEAARPFYDAVLEASPESLPALKALAEIADQQKRWAKSLSLHTRLVELLPEDDDSALAVRMRKAALHRVLDQTEAAVADWNALLSRHPENEALRGEIVSLLIEAGETGAAEKALESLAASGNPQQRLAALLELNRLHEFGGDFDLASASAREAMGLVHFQSPEYAELFSRLVRLHERHGRLAELEGELDAAAAADNLGGKPLQDLARFHEQTADPVKEEAARERLAAAFPGEIEHRVRLAEIQIRNDRYEAAAATLDSLLDAAPRPPLHLLLMRARVALQGQGREAAADLLAAHLDRHGLDVAAAREILDFARTNYLDGLVERLLREPAMAEMESREDASAPIELARFLHERGRAEQALETLDDFVEAAGDSTLDKAARLSRVAAVLKDFGKAAAALEALDEAIALAPEKSEYLAARADLLVAEKRIDEAIAQLEAIRERRAGLDERAEIDQRLFSLIRGHYATLAEKEVEDPGVLQGGAIQSLAQYRRLAAAANQAAARSGDEPPPQELTDYYAKIKKAAKDAPSTANRYRAAWWALKLQDNQECFDQLNRANEEAGRPVVEVEKMLLSLAETNERTTLMVRHLSTLAEIDPENADDYRQRRAAMRFELGFEDEAVRELKALAEKPGAPLSTLNTLAKVYQRQGSTGRQVEVWQRAYRAADLHEKRSIVRQLSNALVESGRPDEALAAQLDLLGRETDPVQRRRQLDAQLTLAQSHFLLDWLRDRFVELAARHPLDRFFPEALARVHRAAGNDREAYEAMRRAYYLSGRGDELLGELGTLSETLGDLDAALYYRRQLLARGEGGTLENWREFVKMLEKDLRVGEADELRRRLETKFGTDTDFLAELTDHYLRAGSPRDAQRTLARLVELRGWDWEARFRLGLLQSQREDNEAAFATFEALLAETAAVAYPEGFDERLLPLVRVSSLERDRLDGDGLSSFVFTIEAYPFIGGNLQDEIADALQTPRPEFAEVPREPHLLRLRAIEEAGSLAARLGRAATWLEQWNKASRPTVERLWATRHAGAREAFSGLLDAWPDEGSHTDQLFLAYCRLLAGNTDRFLAWVAEESPESGTQHSRAVYGAMAALVLLKDQNDDPLYRADAVHESLAGLAVPKTVANHFFAELRRARRHQDAYRLGRHFAEGILADEPSFHFALSQIAGFAGLPAERVHWLDRSLRPDPDVVGSRLPTHFYAALSERLSLFASDPERTDYLADLASRWDASSPAESARFERELIFALAHRDTLAVVAGIARIVSRRAELARPATADRNQIGHEQHQHWQGMSRLLHHYADRIRLDPGTAPAFVAAFGTATLADATDASVASQFEQFEIDRHLLLLEGRNALERAALVRALQGTLTEPESRLELAKALESRGFHREAVPVYRLDAIRRDRDYAPLQGLFSAAAEALDPAPALAVIAQINTREFPAPPGLTVDYLNEEHARFLLMDGDFERLAQLGRQPVAGADAPPVTSRSYLPYEAALVEGYHRFGDDAKLLSLLGGLREREGASGEQLLLGAETLARLSREEEALEWLEPLALDPSETSIQRRALVLSISLHRSLGWKDPDALRALAAASFERQPVATTRQIAAALHEAGAIDEALGILRLLRRQSDDSARRETISMDLLRLSRLSGAPWEDLEVELEAFFHDFSHRAEGDGTNALTGALRPNSFSFAEWIAADPEAKAALPALLSTIAVPERNRWLAELLEGYCRDRLGASARAALADSGGGSELESFVLETLPGFGDVGDELARALVAESARPGTGFFANDARRQLSFFHRIGDRDRLAEVCAQLAREAQSDFFHQSGLEDWLPTLDTRHRLPGFLASLGERELAAALFRAYDETISAYRWNHLTFLEAYAAFLVEGGEFEAAESLVKRILQKSLRFDLRILARLYAAWGKLDEWESRTRDLHLARGQQVLLRAWSTALAEGRELSDYRREW